MIDRDELAKEIFVHTLLSRIPENLLVKGCVDFQRSMAKIAYAWADVFLLVREEESENQAEIVSKEKRDDVCKCGHYRDSHEVFEDDRSCYAPECACTEFILAAEKEHDSGIL